MEIGWLDLPLLPICGPSYGWLDLPVSTLTMVGGVVSKLLQLMSCLPPLGFIRIGSYVIYSHSQHKMLFALEYLQKTMIPLYGIMVLLMVFCELACTTFVTCKNMTNRVGG